MKSQQHLGNTCSAENPLCVSSAQQPPHILSPLSLSDWRGSVTTFRDLWQTTPVGQLKNAEWPVVVSLLAPSLPAVVPDKARSEFFLPCLLKEAPLVGRTLENAQKAGLPTVGKMRSSQHVTEAKMLVMDIDGLPEPDFAAGLAKIAGDGISFLAYTTFSHGKADKPGMRVRLVIPVDRDLDIEAYHAVWLGFDQRYWDGQAGKADPSGARLCQQQGAWCCHRDRGDQARFWAHNDGVVSADALREIGAPCIEPPRSHPPVVAPRCPKKRPRFRSAVLLPDDDKGLLQLRALLASIDPDSHHDDWLRVLAVIFNESGGSEEGFALANDWSCNGKKYKSDGEILTKWKSFNLDHPNPAKLGTLIKMVEDAGYDWKKILCAAEGGFDIVADADRPVVS